MKTSTTFVIPIVRKPPTLPCVSFNPKLLTLNPTAKTILSSKKFAPTIKIIKILLLGGAAFTAEAKLLPLICHRTACQHNSLQKQSGNQATVPSNKAEELREYTNRSYQTIQLQNCWQWRRKPNDSFNI
jgi:hypothetical protein